MLSIPVGIIYMATNTYNGKSYIGQTIKKLHRRKIQHKYASGKGNSRSAFHSAIRKYGWSSFEWSIICKCSSIKEMNEMETFYIKEVNTLSPMGYNLTYGGDNSCGYKLTEEHKQKARIAHLGCKETDETKERKSIARIKWLKTHSISEETCRKISISKRKYTDEIVNTALDYRKAGLKFDDISSIMSIKKVTIQRWCRKAGIVSRRNQ